VGALPFYNNGMECQNKVKRYADGSKTMGNIHTPLARQVEAEWSEETSYSVYW
jgi:hypothetical protein